jgi:hypothetical protein
MPDRACASTGPTGLPCRAAPLLDRPFCLMHDPDHAEKAAEARRLGGARRRHESTLAEVYDLGDLAGVAGIRRLLDVVADGLGLDAGIGRLRVLLAGIGQATRLLETADLAARVEALEALARPQKPPAPLAGIGRSLLDESDR